MDARPLLPNSQPAHPPRVPLPDHVHRLVALDRTPRRLHITNPLRGVHASCDRSVIRLHDGVHVVDRSGAATALPDAFLLHAGNRRAVAACAVRVDDAGPRMRRIRQRLAEQAVGRRGSAPPRAHAVDRSASGIEGAGEGAPTAPDTNVGLSDTPGPLGGLEMTAQPLLQLGTGVLDPAPDGRVVRFQTALAEPLFAIAERERVPQGPAHSAQNQLGLGLSLGEDRRSNGLLHHLFRLPAAAGRSCHTTDHRLMQRLSGTAMDFLVVAAISTINVEVGTGGVRAVLPPTAWKQLADAQVDGWRRWGPYATPRPHRLWSRGDEVANVVELSPGFGRKWRSIPQKYNRFDITDHHRSDMGPSKPRVAGSNPAGRAISLENSPIVPTASAPGAKVQANKVTGQARRLAD